MINIEPLFIFAHTSSHVAKMGRAIRDVAIVSILAMAPTRCVVVTVLSTLARPVVADVMTATKSLSTWLI